MKYIRSKRRFTLLIGVCVILVLGLLYYLRPFWWESYRYENDQIEVRVHDAKGRSLDESRAGTLVIRLTGNGMERCGWGHSAFKNQTGSANDALLSIDSISTQFTDEAGIAQVPPYAGIGSGRRGFMGGCQSNPGFLLLFSRPGYVTKRTTPRIDKLNASYQVISQPRPRKDTQPMIEYARNRLWNAVQLLYPTRIYVSATRPEEAVARQALMSMGGYWQHQLPDGQVMRRYAIAEILRVNAGLECPRLQAKIREIFSDPMALPATEAAVLAEHNALRDAFSRSSQDGIDGCSQTWL